MAEEHDGDWTGRSAGDESTQGHDEHTGDDNDRPTLSLPPYDGGEHPADGQTTPVNAGSDGVKGSEDATSPQPTEGGYRPAPQYGAYGPVPAQQNQQPTDAQGHNATAAYGATQPQPQPQPGADGGAGSMPNGAPAGGQNDRNPYYGADAYGNPFVNRNPYGQGQPGGASGGQTPNPGPGYPQRNPFMNQPGSGPQPTKTVNPLVSAIIAAIVVAAVCLGLGYAALSNGWVSVPASTSISGVGSSPSSSGSAPLKAGQSANWTEVSKAVSGSVVSIQTTVSGGVAKGSGAVIDNSGHIVTNNHVISGATAIQVTLSNGQIYSAKLVGTDTTTDLAVIKLDNPPSDLKAVTFADSDALAVGEGVMAIGNPLGYDDTATTGIVSALNRPVSVTDENQTEIVTNAVQIDAAINPGNSGGPTFNAAGQVIGINSSIATASSSSSSSSSESGSIGIGFAIPANLVKRVSNEIVKDGSVKHVKLGVTIQSSTAEADGVTRGGAKVVQVTSGSPADKAGLKSGDTIVAFNGNAVNNNYSVLGFVRASALGDKVKLTVVRDGKAIEVDVTLDQQEDASASTSNGSGQNNNGGGNGNNNGNGNGGNGNGNGNGNGGGDDGNGNGNGDGDGGNGFSDPFGLW